MANAVVATMPPNEPIDIAMMEMIAGRQLVASDSASVADAVGRTASCSLGEVGGVATVSSVVRLNVSVYQRG